MNMYLSLCLYAQIQNMDTVFVHKCSLSLSLSLPLCVCVYFIQGLESVLVTLT
jgi:hypothetical protein